MFEVRRRLTLAALLFATFAFTFAAASAQTITGTIRGTITDPSGAVIRGAKVTATNVATAVKTSTVSDAAGEYSMQFLPVGVYKVTVTAAGFDTTSVSAFSLDIDQTAKIDAQLKVGSNTVTVTVPSDVSPLLQTQDATTGATIDSETIIDIPNNGLNFQFDTLFVPGAVNPSLDSMASAGRQ